MTVLAIDTSTELLGVALATEAGAFYEWAAIAGYEHAQRLLPAIDAVLAAADLKASDIALIACARGPGSFTGLRIGMATAKGLAAAVGAPIVSVPTLDALAYPFAGCARTVIPVLDARKKRVYCAAYCAGKRTTEYLDIAVESIRDTIGHDGPLLVTGVSASLLLRVSSALGEAYIDPCPERGRGAAYVHLAKEALASDGADAPDAGPLYIRKSDAEIARSPEN